MDKYIRQMVNLGYIIQVQEVGLREMYIPLVHPGHLERLGGHPEHLERLEVVRRGLVELLGHLDQAEVDHQERVVHLGHHPERQERQERVVRLGHHLEQVEHLDQVGRLVPLVPDRMEQVVHLVG
jgi:hypothetical protein